MSADAVPLSDKATWHRYLGFYEPHLQRLAGARRVLEFGVFHGASVRYLHERFPEAHVFGADILPVQPEWPTGDWVTYVQVDQGDRAALAALLDRHPGPYDLVVEDGSHAPEHQRNCLVAALPRVRSGGAYVLEDLHTSHPAHPMSRGGRRRGAPQVNCYGVLLAFEHLRSTGQELDDRITWELTRRGLLTEPELRELFARVAAVDLYRRAALPLRCYRCQGERFDYAQQRCACGVPLMEPADSMTAVITVR